MTCLQRTKFVQNADLTPIAARPWCRPGGKTGICGESSQEGANKLDVSLATLYQLMTHHDARNHLSNHRTRHARTADAPTPTRRRGL